MGRIFNVVGASAVIVMILVLTHRGEAADRSQLAQASTPTSAAAAQLPPPVLGRTVHALPVSGKVLLRGRRRAVPLRTPRQIRVGSLLDTRHGLVELVTATERPGETQSGRFSGGVFEVRQDRDGGGLTELRLRGGSYDRCPRAKSARTASLFARAAQRRRRSVVRTLRASASGRFSTRGRDSEATVRGTEWETVDRCDGTLTRVAVGEAAVRDFKTRADVVLGASERHHALPDLGCVRATFQEEGREHPLGPVQYETNPPTSGGHHPVPASDGVYPAGVAPASEQAVHALEHGRIAIQYVAGLAAQAVGALDNLARQNGRGHVLLFQNNTAMQFPVAATAWRQLIGCRAINDRVAEAIGAFREQHANRAPEFVPGPE